MEQAAKSGRASAGEAIDKARAALEKAMGKKIDAAAANLQAFANRNDALEKAQPAGAVRNPSPAAKPASANKASAGQAALKALAGRLQIAQRRGYVRRGAPAAASADACRHGAAEADAVRPRLAGGPAADAADRLALPPIRPRPCLRRWRAWRWRAPRSWAPTSRSSPPATEAFEVSLAVSGERRAIAWHGSTTGPDAIHFEWLDKAGRAAEARPSTSPTAAASATSPTCC